MTEYPRQNKKININNNNNSISSNNKNHNNNNNNNNNKTTRLLQNSPAHTINKKHLINNNNYKQHYINNTAILHERAARTTEDYKNPLNSPAHQSDLPLGYAHAHAPVRLRPTSQDILHELLQTSAKATLNGERYGGDVGNQQRSTTTTTTSSKIIFKNQQQQLPNASSIYSKDLAQNYGRIRNMSTAAAAAAATKMTTATTPESDYNSNATTPGSREGGQQHLQQQYGIGVGGGNNLNLNLNASSLTTSSHDFTTDNSDYQWFLDYGYRDGCGGNGMQRSVLTALTTSYNPLNDLLYYEDLAKNMDANLAEVDMENFRSTDINSLLACLPNYCRNLSNANSLQQSLLLQQQQQQQQQHQLQQQHQQYQQQFVSTQQLTQNALAACQMSTNSINDIIDRSVFKSDLLFSPVKESHISVSDSLDLDPYPDEDDLMLTCQANKDNYTIAFEGSTIYSDESFYDTNECATRNRQNFINLHGNLEDIIGRTKALEVSMCRSDQQLQQQHQLQSQQQTRAKQLQRCPSGNNNTETETITITRRLVPQSSVRKSKSLPDLQCDVMTCSVEPALVGSPAHQQGQRARLQQQLLRHKLNVSQAVSTSTMDTTPKAHNMLPMCPMPISASASISERLQEALSRDQSPSMKPIKHHRCCCATNASDHCMHVGAQTMQAAQQQKNQQQQKPHSSSASSSNSSMQTLNLVKKFIKQKSTNCSADDQTCMDVSSGCWPSSEAVGGGGGSSSSSSLNKQGTVAACAAVRKKSMNDSGKGSANSRHDEEDEDAFNNEHSKPKTAALRTRLDAVFYDDNVSSSSGGSVTLMNSPAHRRRTAPPPRNLQLQPVVGQSQSSNTQQSAQTAMLEARKSTASNSEMITRSMQTSCGSLSSHSSLGERLRLVPPSFLEKLNNLGEEQHAPIYVIYPNYALPDLGFVNKPMASNVILSPFGYGDSCGLPSSTSSTKDANEMPKRRKSLTQTDDELLKKLDPSSVQDWESLYTLLPGNYRRRLKHIPEVKGFADELNDLLSVRPSFCTSAKPVFEGIRLPAYEDTISEQTQTEEMVNSSSGSSHQPSSGYRGSSTLLTDSELDSNNTDPLKQMYVYQYDQQSEQPPPPPQPRPRGILRKAVSAGARLKRNSMIEPQQNQQTKQEKRRSLPEPPQGFAVAAAGALDKLSEEELDLEPVSAGKQTEQSRSGRLSRKDIDARARAENFLSTIPRSELKYYAEIAAILESSSEKDLRYDAAELKKEVGRALIQHKKVSFNELDRELLTQRRFSTPPNSPNISVAQGAVPRRTRPGEDRKADTYRFRRLQTQWELLSKESELLKEFAANEPETKSGGSTPTSAAKIKSRIPRPVSYPAGSLRRQSISKKSTESETKPKLPKRPPVIAPRSKSLSSRLPTARISNQDNTECRETRLASRLTMPKRFSSALPGSARSAVTSPTTTGPRTAMTTKASSAKNATRTPTSRISTTAPSTPKRTNNTFTRTTTKPR